MNTDHDPDARRSRSSTMVAGAPASEVFGSVMTSLEQSPAQPPEQSRQRGWCHTSHLPTVTDAATQLHRQHKAPRRRNYDTNKC